MASFVAGFLQGVEGEQVATLLGDAGEAVATVGGCAGGVAPAAGGEGGAVGRVVGRLPDDDRVLTGLEHARAVGLVPESGLEGRQIEGSGRSGRAILTCMMVRVLGP